jgi:hypothetical protein
MHMKAIELNKINILCNIIIKKDTILLENQVKNI